MPIRTALLPVIFLSAASSACATNLITNGSFELPMVQPGTYQAAAPGAGLSGWTVVGSGGSVALVSSSFVHNRVEFPAKTKDQWINLSGFEQGNVGNGVQQTVHLQSDVDYTLEFYVGTVHGCGTSTVNIYLNGGYWTQFSQVRGERDQMTWRRATIALPHGSSQMTIGFINASGPESTCVGLDAITLRPATAVEVVPSMGE